MPSIVLKLKHHNDEVVDVQAIEVEVSFDEDDPEKGNFNFTIRNENDEGEHCFIITEKGLKHLVEFYEQVKK